MFLDSWHIEVNLLRNDKTKDFKNADTLGFKEC